MLEMLEAPKLAATTGLPYEVIVDHWGDRGRCDASTFRQAEPLLSEVDSFGQKRNQDGQ